MSRCGRVTTSALMTVALGAGLLVGSAPISAAGPVTARATIDRPTPPKERPDPGTRPDPRCDRAQEGLAVAKANVQKARQRLKTAPKSKKPARRTQLKSAKQARAVAKARAARYCQQTVIEPGMA